MVNVAVFNCSQVDHETPYEAGRHTVFDVSDEPIPKPEVTSVITHGLKNSITSLDPITLLDPTSVVGEICESTTP